MCSSDLAEVTVQGISTNTNPANTTLISIPALGIASVYPSTIPVAGLASNPSKVTVTLTTHSEGGLTEKDFDLAMKIDQL